MSTQYTNIVKLLLIYQQSFVFIILSINSRMLASKSMSRIIHTTRQMIMFMCSTTKQTKSVRMEIVPQPFTMSPLQVEPQSQQAAPSSADNRTKPKSYMHITSKSYDFILQSPAPPVSHSLIYPHHPDSPSSILRKPGIHIYPDSMPPHFILQKYRAYTRKLQEDYSKAYEKCINGSQVFHMQRRIKTDIKQRCRFIGKILGKYRHYNLFKSLNQLIAQKTAQEYKKNGIQVSVLGKTKIYPQGPVWLPTSETYLKLFQQYLSQSSLVSPSSILDLGCGSGILSYILSKTYKNSKIYSVDNNKHAISTTQLNAATLGIQNITAVLSDIKDSVNMEVKLRQKGCNMNFDLIVTNPPWLIGKRNAYQSQILDGVYDQKGKFLASSFAIAGKYLSSDKKSRFILIYSDLSSILGIQPKSIQQLCKKFNLLIHSKLETQYPNAIGKSNASGDSSPLSTYKIKSKVQVYEIGRS